MVASTSFSGSFNPALPTTSRITAPVPHAAAATDVPVVSNRNLIVYAGPIIRRASTELGGN